MKERIKKDKKNPGVLIEVHKSDAYWDIAMFVQHKIITMDDLVDFSEDVRDAVKLILNR